VSLHVVSTLLQGGRAMNFFCRQIKTEISVVDVEVAEDITHDKLISRKTCHGTNNFLKQDAMSEAEVEKALMIGSEEAGNVIANGAKALIVGEVGIGNTTSASALLAAILDVPVEIGRASCRAR